MAMPTTGAGKALESGLNNLVSSLGDTIANLQTPIDSLTRGISAVQSQVASFVSAINPAAVKAFEFATKDLYATVGQILVPVLGNLTAIVREVAAGIYSLSPQGKTMIAVVVGAGVAMTVAAAGAVALSAAVNSLTAGIPAILGALAGGLAGLGLALKDTAGVSEIVGKAMDVFRQITDGIGKAVLGAVAQMSTLMPAIDTIVGAMSGLIEAGVDVFGSAMSGLMGVLKSVTPFVVSVATGAAMFGEVLGSVLAVTVRATGGIVELLVVPLQHLARVGEAVQSALRPAFAALTDAFQDLGQLIDDLAGVSSILLSDVMQDLGEVVIPIFRSVAEAFASAIKWVAEKIREATTVVRDFFGIERRADVLGDKKDPTGLAVRDTSITSVDSFLQSAYQSAFAGGRGGKEEDPMAGVARDAAEAKQRAMEVATKIETWLTDRAVDYGFIKAAVSGFADGVGQAVSAPVRVAEAMTDPWRARDRINKLNGG